MSHESDKTLLEKSHYLSQNHIITIRNATYYLWHFLLDL